MTKVAIIIASTRPNRVGPKVANWFFEKTKDQKDVEFELVDLIDYKLPILDEPQPAADTKDHTKKWAAKIAEFDGYVFVTPEYNHGVPGSFKNAIDFLNRQWQYKPVSYVSYGVLGGSRSVEQLRQIAAQFHQFDLRAQVTVIAPWEYFNENGEFVANEHHDSSASNVIDEISFWANAMKPLREQLQNS